MSRALLARRSLVIMAVAAAVAACGTTPATQPGGSSTATAGFPRTVKHAMGETTIPAAPKKVAALDASFVDAAIALETEVVAFTSYRSIGDRVPDYLGEPGKRLSAGAKAVGTLAEPKIELILNQKPDLIVSAKVRHEQIYGQLSAKVPTVFSDTTGPTWKENIRLLGKALGKEDLAEQKIKAYEDRARRIGDAIRAKEGKNPTISIVRFVDGPTRLYQQASFSGIVMKDAGLARPPAQSANAFAAEISEERITDADADKIFVATYPDEKGSSAATRQRFETNPLWRPLAPKTVAVNDLTWVTAVSLQGAHIILDDLAKAFGVDPAKS
ncbi:iron complex transport system substrate-binding protein [Allokutzneria albata]|uniref:Iron complex transport system substrate-binding protein n=2 Tax=Allokutzneria albata TaxID=211114 RepID=A0A1H0ALJ1_ALLAB|nr:iron complex transport system substrate-binding protein [Allokutzneria albata]